MNLFDRSIQIGIEGFLHCNECEKLADLACNRDVLEIGSFKGLSAWCMAPTAKTLTCLDTFSAATDGQKQTGTLTTFSAFLTATSRFRNVTHVIGLSCNVEITRDFDLIFLDATHTYEDFKADIQHWWPKVRRGGVFAFHDYGHHSFPGIKQAADEIFGPATEENVCVTLRWIDKP